MRRKIITALVVAGIGVLSVSATANAVGRDGRCVAANLSGLSGEAKSGVAKTGPGALAGAIWLHLDGDLDLLGVCD
jgi:hypothetical protein